MPWSVIWNGSYLVHVLPWVSAVGLDILFTDRFNAPRLGARWLGSLSGRVLVEQCRGVILWVGSPFSANRESFFAGRESWACFSLFSLFVQGLVLFRILSSMTSKLVSHVFSKTYTLLLSN